MSDTKPINHSRENNNAKKAGMAAAGLGAAAAGAAGVAMAMNAKEDIHDDTPKVEPVKPEEINEGISQEQVIDETSLHTPENTGSTNSSANQNTGTGYTTQQTTNTQHIDEPQPVVQPVGGQTGNEEPVVTGQTGNEEQVVTGQTGNQEPVNTGGEEVVTQQPNVNSDQYDPGQDLDPNQIASAIIAENQIDPDDINAESVVNFEEIGTIYAVNGQSYNGATFVDPNGNRLAMVDVDNDNKFDAIMNEQGEFLTNASGQVIAPSFNLTMDDALEHLNPGATYIAANDNPDHPDVDPNAFMQDIITEA